MIVFIVVLLIRVLLFYSYVSFLFDNSGLIYCHVGGKYSGAIKKIGAVTLSLSGTIGMWDSYLEENNFVKPTGWIYNYLDKKFVSSINEPVPPKFENFPVIEDKTHRLVNPNATNDSIITYSVKYITKLSQEKTLSSNKEMRQLYLDHLKSISENVSKSDD